MCYLIYNYLEIFQILAIDLQFTPTVVRGCTLYDVNLLKSIETCFIDQSMMWLVNLLCVLAKNMDSTLAD